MLAKGGAIEIDLASQVLLTDEHLQVAFPDGRGKHAPAVVTVALDDSHRDRLQLSSSRSDTQALLHQAATLSLVLEEKTALGLAAPPEEDVPWELLPESALESRALAERVRRAAEEPMTVKPASRTGPWSDYTVGSASSGKAYRVALRGMERGQSYCSCPDFRKNLLGTCKHVMRVQSWAKKKSGATGLATPWRPERFGVFARYDGTLRLGLEAPARVSSAAKSIAGAWRNRFAAEGAELVELVESVRKLSRLGEEVTVYPDVEQILEQTLHRHRMSELVAQIRADPAAHPLRRELLLPELLPYQLDGIAFAAGNGRAVLADEMGLGKTIQGVGVAELLARYAGIQRVLIVYPASLKSQWRAEIGRFCGRSVQLVSGKASERARAMAAARSSPSATTNRCCATSSPSSARIGT